MKKVVLICLAVTTSFAFSQGRLARPDLSRVPAFYGGASTDVNESKTDQNIRPYAVQKKRNSTNSTQTVQTLGSSSNALTAWGIRHCLWADPVMNTVLFTRRAIGLDTGVINSGRLFYDISFDGGLTFDTGRGPVYTPSYSTVLNPSNARYPQAAIYNPAGSANPMDAYMTYYAASLNNTNPSGSVMWGGNVYGSHKLNLATPPTQHELISDSASRTWFNIPELMHMCKNGTTYVLSESNYGNSDLYGRGISYDYMDTMILEKGIWDITTNDYNYSRQLIAVPAGLIPYDRWIYHPYVGTLPSDPVSTMMNSGIVFNDNGQTGYIVCKLFSNIFESPDTTVLFHIYKTTDGGLNWARTNGTPYLDEIDKLCQDSGFAMGIAGEEFDVAMDANDNLHIIVVVGTKYMEPHPAIGTTVYYQENYGGLFDLFTTDGGYTWFAHKLKTDPIQEIFGVMGDPSTASARRIYDNRPQITRSWDGTKLFFSWFETDTVAWLPISANAGYNNDDPDLHFNNQNPDMHVVGYDVTTNLWTTEINATAFPALNGDADGACWLGSVAYYALDNGSGGYKIPTVIGTPSAPSTNNNPDWLKPFTFKYLDGIEVAANAYTIPPSYWGPFRNEIPLYLSGITPIAQYNDFVVSPIKPNPVRGKSELSVQISKPGDIHMSIRNMLGQEVFSMIYFQQPPGLRSYSLETDNFDAGIYLITVTFDGRQHTQRIAVH